MKKKTIIIPTLLFVVGIIGAICVIVLWDRSDSAEQLKFEYEKGKSGVIVTGFTGEPKAIIIPDEIDGYPVTEIGYNAFFGCDALTEITLPKSVISIGDMAFSGCSSLKQAVIPEKTESIGEWAFFRCNSLKQITVPSSVTLIDTAAFSGCSALESVYYAGTQEMWKQIEIGYENVPLFDAEKIFSSAEP